MIYPKKLRTIKTKSSGFAESSFLKSLAIYYIAKDLLSTKKGWKKDQLENNVFNEVLIKIVAKFYNTRLITNGEILCLRSK